MSCVCVMLLNHTDFNMKFKIQEPNMEWKQDMVRGHHKSFEFSGTMFKSYLLERGILTEIKCSLNPYNQSIATWSMKNR